jgi:hypothetical protein
VSSVAGTSSSILQFGETLESLFLVPPLLPKGSDGACADHLRLAERIAGPFADLKNSPKAWYQVLALATSSVEERCRILVQRSPNPSSECRSAVGNICFTGQLGMSSKNLSTSCPAVDHHSNLSPSVHFLCLCVLGKDLMRLFRRAVSRFSLQYDSGSSNEATAHRTGAAPSTEL